MKYRHWFFDLDGTLARTGEDIVVAWKGALTALGRDLANFDKVFKIGPTLEKIVYELYDDATPRLIEDLMARFKPLYDESGFPNTVPYEGIEEFLAELDRAGAKMYIVTNKRHAPTRLIAAKFGWDRVFDGIWSYDTLDVKYSKPDLVRRLLGELGVDPSDAVMVGDTAGDIDTGKRNAMFTVGVAYGYGTREELAGADVVCDSAEELKELLKN